MPKEHDDLTVEINNLILNIRVMLLIKYQGGYLFEHHEDGYYFVIGGRVKMLESTEQAALRELNEELKRTDIKVKLSGLIENFFTYKGQASHELNFVYSGELNEAIDLTELDSDHLGYVVLTKEQINALDIKPRALKQLILMDRGFAHLVNRD